MNPSQVLIDAVCRRMPHILGQQCRSRSMPAYGCFDREYWSYGTCDVPNARKQEAVLTLALMYLLDVKGNPYYRSPAVREWISAGIRYWAGIQLRSGAFNDLYANEHSYVATAFSTYAVGQTLLYLGKELRSDQVTLVPALERACEWLASRPSSPVPNQTCGAAAALSVCSVFLDERRWADVSGQMVSHVQLQQSSEGWFSEYGGPDVGYLSVAVDYLGKTFILTKNDVARQTAVKACRFLRSLVLPDGQVGGEYGSRATSYLIPDGFAIFSQDCRDAADLLSVVVRLLSSQRGVLLPNLDDKYVLFNGYTYLQAAMRPCRFGDASSSSVSADFGLSGIHVRHHTDIHLVANLRKGGAFVAQFVRTGKTLHDGGLVLEDAMGRRLTTCCLGASQSTEVASNVLACRGSLARPFDNRMSPCRHLLLVLFAATLGRFQKGRDLLKRLLRAVVIERKRCLHWLHSRRVIVSGGVLEVEDVVDVPWPCQVFSGGSQESIYGESARYFNSSELDFPPLPGHKLSVGCHRIRRWYDGTNEVRMDVTESESVPRADTDAGCRSVQRNEFSQGHRYTRINPHQARVCLEARKPYLWPRLAELDRTSGTFVEVSGGSGYTLCAVAVAFPHVRLVVTEFVAERLSHPLYDGIQVEKHVCAMETMPIPSNSVDMLYCNGVLHHVQNLRQALDEVWRVLRPGTTAVFIEPNRMNPFYALVGKVKRVERGVITTDYDTAFKAFSEHHHDIHVEEFRFSCYATFHGNVMNTLAGWTSKVLLFPELCKRFRSHRVFVMRKG